MNLPDPEETFLQDLNLLLYQCFWDGKHNKIKRSGVFQAHEAGGLKMVDVKSFLSAFKIGRLKRILCDDGKITKILQKMYPSIQNIKKKKNVGISKCNHAESKKKKNFLGRCI